MSKLAVTRCREVVELLSDHLDDALAAPQRDLVEGHLATCPDCTAYLAQLRTTVDLLGRLRAQPLRRIEF